MIHKKIFKESIRNNKDGNGQNYYDHIIYKEGNTFIYKYLNESLYFKIKKLYNKISDIRGVQEMTFNDSTLSITSPEYNTPLTGHFTNEEKAEIKKQLITFLKELNSRGISHRDLHIKNAFFHDRKRLKIIDWEFIEIDNNFYDITGNDVSPLSSGHMNIFENHKFSFFIFFDKNISLI